MTPVGVHGVKSGSDARDERWPMLYAWNLREKRDPSQSLAEPCMAQALCTIE